MKKILFIFMSAVLLFSINSCDKEGGASFEPGRSNATGQGGSYARFSIVGDYLYTLNGNLIVVYDISNPTEMELKGTVVINNNFDMGIPETIFSYNGHLLIGAPNGMYIYSLSNPEKPLYVSIFNHILACDPVVAENGYAYITMNSTSTCRMRSGASQLEVADLTNINSPSRVAVMQMNDPKGLGIDDENLFVCNENKIMVFDVNNPSVLTQIGELKVNQPYDVIPYNKNLIVTSGEGILQYDYSNITDIKLLSKIKAK